MANPFEDFADKHLTCLDRHTTVIVQAMPVREYAGACLDIFAEIAKRSRAVIWLNPEPETYWGSGRQRNAALRAVLSHRPDSQHLFAPNWSTLSNMCSGFAFRR